MANYTNTYTKGRPSTGYKNNIASMFRQWYQANVDIKQQEYMYKTTGENVTWNRVDWDNAKPAYWDNPYWTRYENYEDDTRERLIGYAKVDWKITDFLDVMGRYSIDTYSYLQEERKAQGSIPGAMGVGRADVSSGYSRLTRNFIETNADLVVNFHKALSTVVDLSALLGTNIRRNKTDQVFASTNNGLSVPRTYALSNSLDPMLPPEELYQRLGVNGIFGNISIGYKNTVYLEGSLRRDQSSTLPKENNAYFYPSVTGNLIFSNLFESSWLSFGKLRLNYAEVGNSAAPLSLLDYYTIVSSYQGTSFATLPDQKNNPGLKPERSKSYEVGLEASLLKNRVGFDLSYYNTSTFDQLTPLSISFATGFESKWINAGEINNKGVELTVWGVPVKTKDFNWDVKVNWTRNRNKVVSLYKDEFGNEVTNLQLNPQPLQGGVTINARVGEPYGVISGQDYTYNDKGQKIIRPNGTYLFSSSNMENLGNMNPEWNGGISNTFTYKNVAFSFLIDAQKGGSVFSLDMYYGLSTGLFKETVGLNDLGNPKRDPIVWADPSDHSKGYASNSGGVILDGVLADGTPNTLRLDGNGWSPAAAGYRSHPNSAFVYDASFVKLREASVTYHIPKAFLAKTKAITEASLSLVGSNLWIIYKALPYADPEASQGAGNIQGWQSGVLPATRNIGFTLNVQF
jgi:outer membrane receptor protein involved in Fe transport